jgi:head-tail adaptor
MIQPGRMKTPLEVQAYGETGTGIDAVRGWTTVPGVVWAEMWAVKGDERAMSGRDQAAISHRVRMWSFPGLTTTAHRFKLGARTFNISFINDVEMRGIEYVVDCLEIVGGDAQ